MSDDSQALLRRCQRVIRMVGELHRSGFQHLRIMAYEHPLAWRLAIAPRDLFAANNGFIIPAELFGSGPMAIYSAASGNDYFDWEDARRDTARQLALKFVERFGHLAAFGEGRDWEYAGWLSELTGFLEREKRLPLAPEHSYLPPYRELKDVPTRDYLTGIGDRFFVLPPPGLGAPIKIQSAKIPADQLMIGYQDRGDVQSLMDFQAVASVLGLVMAAGVRKWETPGDASAGEDLLAEVEKAFVNDPGYRRSPVWHTREALGAVLIEAFDLDREWCRAGDYGLVVRFAIDRLADAAADLLLAFSQDEAATWEGHGHPRMNEMHAFAACVFLGTSAELYKGRTLDSFKWRPLDPAPSSLF